MHVDRLYLPRECGRRGMIREEDSVRIKETGLLYYLEKNTEEWSRITCSNKEGIEGITTKVKVESPIS